jgi:hypothetical protein
MKVSAQYAESHFEEILAATDSGQEVEILRPDATGIKLTLVPTAATKINRIGLFGAGRGKVWLAEDWNSSATNGEIAHLFNGALSFLKEPDPSTWICCSIPTLCSGAVERYVAAAIR